MTLKKPFDHCTYYKGNHDIDKSANALELEWKQNKDFADGIMHMRKVMDQQPHLKNYTGRQFFDHLRGPYAPIELDDPPIVTCSENDQPSDCNGFTDGSLINPDTAAWSLGGGGIWYPKRNTNAHPLHKNEYEATFDEVVDGGLGLFCPVPGQLNSSTRTEIVPGILSCSCPYQIKLGADSANFILLANKIIADPFWKPPKCWGLTPNGDLWEAFQIQVQKRQGGLWPIQKIKAHTKITDIARGISTQPRREGNEHADKLARKGVGSHSKGLAQLAYAFSKFDMIYVAFLECIHDMLIRVYKATEQRRLAAPPAQRKPPRRN